MERYTTLTTWGPRGFIITRLLIALLAGGLTCYVLSRGVRFFDSGYLQVMPAVCFGPWLAVAIYSLITIIFWRRLLPIHNRLAARSEAHPRRSSWLFFAAALLYISLILLMGGVTALGNAETEPRTPEIVRGTPASVWWEYHSALRDHNGSHSGSYRLNVSLEEYPGITFVSRDVKSDAMFPSSYIEDSPWAELKVRSDDYHAWVLRDAKPSFSQKHADPHPHICEIACSASGTPVTPDDDICCTYPLPSFNSSSGGPRFLLVLGGLFLLASAAIFALRNKIKG